MLARPMHGCLRASVVPGGAAVSLSVGGRGCAGAYSSTVCCCYSSLIVTLLVLQCCESLPFLLADHWGAVSACCSGGVTGETGGGAARVGRGEGGGCARCVVPSACTSGELRTERWFLCECSVLVCCTGVHRDARLQCCCAREVRGVAREGVLLLGRGGYLLPWYSPCSWAGLSCLLRITSGFVSLLGGGRGTGS
jgi:hypothetical protein